LFTDTFLPKIDGIVTVICLLLDHLEQRGIEAVVVAPKLGVTHYNSAKVIGVPGVRLPLYPELTIGPSMLSTYRQLQAFQPDVAHIIHPFLIGVPGMVMARRLGIPILTSFHLDVARLTRYFNLGFVAPILTYLTRVVFNTADYSLAPSRMIQQEMIA